jgi:peptidylprolyl isomerase
MSNPVKDRSGVGLPPKAERRAAGKLAAAQRARAKRRKRLLKNVLTFVAVLAVIAAVAVACGAFRDSPTSTADPQTSASAEAVTLDPALQTKPVVTGGTGDVTELKVTPLIEGNGPAVATGQKLSVNYVGVSYKTGAEFDSSWKASPPTPFPFTIGQGGVIPGWDQGLLGVKVGSRVQLDIPANLAYGETTTDGSPAGDLRFVVDVLSAT